MKECSTKAGQWAIPFLERAMHTLFWGLLPAIVFTGCTASKIVNASKLKLQQDFCVAPAAPDDSLLPSVPDNSNSIVDPELDSLLSRQDILVASASGTLPFIKGIVQLGKDSTANSNRLYSQYSLQIDRNLALLRSEIETLSSELACETFRTRQLSAYLANLNAKRTSRLTVAAIAVGSLTTLLPVFVNGKAGQNSIAIGGGVVAAGLGGLTLRPGRYFLKMMTYRNLLQGIWLEQNTAQTYLPGPWLFLTDAGLGTNAGISKARVLKMRWLKFDLNNALDKKTEQLLFGDGGIFGQDDLDLRATMLSELSVEVNSMRQYLEHFSYQIANIKLKALHAAALP